MRRTTGHPANHRPRMLELGSELNLNLMLHVGRILGGVCSWAGLQAHRPHGNYLAAFTRDAAVMIPGGFVPTHYAQLVLV